MANNLDVTYDELEQEFQKLAALVPTIPTDQHLSELEFIEFVIAYIRQLQQLLSYDQWNECIHTLTSSSHSFILQSPRISINESSSTIHQSPLATINFDNTQSS
jgi:hypothetical protein